MSILNSIQKYLPGFGGTSVYASTLGTSCPAGDTTITLTPAPASPGFKAGYIRVKSATVGAGGTITIKGITGSDGTDTYFLFGGDKNVSAADNKYERVIAFCSDVELTSLAVVVTTAVATSTMDAEAAGNA